MLLIWLLWASLALGGLAGLVRYTDKLRGKWIQVARVPAPVGRPPRHRAPSLNWPPDVLLPPVPRASRAGPPRRPSVP